MAKVKACLECKTIYEGDKCPNCASTAFSESSKGKVHIFNAEKSEIAKNMKIKQNGEYAIKTR